MDSSYAVQADVTETYVMTKGKVKSGLVAALLVVNKIDKCVMAPDVTVMTAAMTNGTVQEKNKKKLQE